MYFGGEKKRGDRGGLGKKIEACQSSLRANNPIPDIGREKALKHEIRVFMAGDATSDPPEFVEVEKLC